MRAAATVATLGHLVWLTGNVREEWTGAIESWADDPPSSPFAQGSPARYYPPIVAVALGASLRVLLVSRSGEPRHGSGIVTAGSSTAALALTVVLVRTVNLPLYGGGVTRERRRRLVRRWHVLKHPDRRAGLFSPRLSSLRYPGRFATMTHPDSTTTAGLRAIAPVFATTDLKRWVAHYRALGFAVEPYDDVYAFARLDDIAIHVGVMPDHDPARTAACAYLTVDDADALHTRWSSVDHGGRDVAPVDTDYGTREGAHIDPDNNLLRYGSSR